MPWKINKGKIITSPRTPIFICSWYKIPNVGMCQTIDYTQWLLLSAICIFVHSSSLVGLHYASYPMHEKLYDS